MYYLPVHFAYNARTPFWEFLYCYGAKDEPFELTHQEFEVCRHNSIDPKTFVRYLSDSYVLGIISHTKSENGTKYFLKAKPKPINSVPKPKSFILNDWLNRLLLLEPIGRRALWLLNFLIRTRWETLNYPAFEQLLSNLKTNYFSYKLPELKNSLDLARGKKTEAPKEALQLLWKLGIVKPLEVNLFQIPQKKQRWEFTLNLARFEEEAFEQHDINFVPVVLLDIVCQILHRQRKRLEYVGYNPAMLSIRFSFDKTLEIITKILSEQNLDFPIGMNLKSLITDFCRELEKQDLICLEKDKRILLKSGRLGNRYKTRPVARNVVDKHFEQIRKLQLEATMDPILQHRNRILGELVLRIGQAFDLPPMSCIDLFLFLQKNADHLPKKRYEDFMTYCEKRIPLLQLGIGYREILDGFISNLGTPLKKIQHIKRVQKEIAMTDTEKEVLIYLPLPLNLISWARLRRILSFKAGSLFRESEGVNLTIELWDASLQTIHKERIQLLSFPKEELAPTLNLNQKLKGMDCPLRARLVLSRPLPQLIVQLILEIAHSQQSQCK